MNMRQSLQRFPVSVYLEGIESDEDVGNYYREMNQQSTQPGQTQHRQQDQNWTGHSPANMHKMHIHEYWMHIQDVHELHTHTQVQESEV